MPAQGIQDFRDINKCRVCHLIYRLFAFPYIFPEEQLISVIWPKNVSIRGRGILAVANYFNAADFADDSIITADNVLKREYHHIYPDSLIEEAKEFYPEELNSMLALNCALITDNTNRVIGRKDPLTYLKERFNWVNETKVKQRLSSHLIPINELAAGSYENMGKQEKADKIKKDYEAFLAKRASRIIDAVKRLASGEDVSASEIISDAR